MEFEKPKRIVYVAGKYKVNITNKHKEDKGYYLARGTPLGNPFHIDEQNDRDAVCDRYEKWLYTEILKETPQRKALRILIEDLKKEEEVFIQCFCAPMRCHLESVAKVMLANITEEEIIRYEE